MSDVEKEQGGVQGARLYERQEEESAGEVDQGVSEDEGDGQEEEEELWELEEQWLESGELQEWWKLVSLWLRGRSGDGLAVVNFQVLALCKDREEEQQLLSLHTHSNEELGVIVGQLALKRAKEGGPDAENGLARIDQIGLSQGRAWYRAQMSKLLAGAHTIITERVPCWLLHVSRGPEADILLQDDSQGEEMPEDAAQQQDRELQLPGGEGLPDQKYAEAGLTNTQSTAEATGAVSQSTQAHPV